MFGFFENYIIKLLLIYKHLYIFGKLKVSALKFCTPTLNTLENIFLMIFFNLLVFQNFFFFIFKKFERGIV